MIFQPVFVKHPRGDFLAYVEPFGPSEGFSHRTVDGKVECIPDPNSGLFRVKRILNPDGSRRGMIINVTDIWRQVDLVPNFSNKCPSNWTSETSTETGSEFFVNHFFDKDIFASFLHNH